MKLFNWRKKEDQILLTNEDWKVISNMLFRYVNRGQNINPIVTKEDYITKAYLYNATVFSVINLRANAAKGIPWIVYRVVNQQKYRDYRNLTSKDFNLAKTLILKEQAFDEVEGGPINDLIAHPNPWMSWQDIIEGMFTYRDCTGDAYLYQMINPGTKRIIQFHLLPSDKTRIIGGTFFNPVAGYRFTELSGDMIPPEKVMHWRYFNPLWKPDGSWLYGMSPLVAATKTINADNEAVNNEWSSFKNEGVKGILTGTNDTEIEFTREQTDLLLKKLKKASQLAKEGEGNIAFNRAPMNYLKIGETPVDLGVLDSKKYNKETLCNVFRIHSSLLSSEASTLDNFKEARKSLLTVSVMPDMDSLRDNLNKMIQGAFGAEWWIDYDLMAIGELQEDIKKLSETLKTMDWVTIDEKRTATNYDDYEPPADGNPAKMLFTDMSRIPLGFGMDSGFEEIDNEIDKRRDDEEDDVATAK